MQVATISKYAQHQIVATARSFWLEDPLYNEAYSVD